jgi:hypothetical protein
VITSVINFTLLLELSAKHLARMGRVRNILKCSFPSCSRGHGRRNENVIMQARVGLEGERWEIGDSFVEF